jgi:hypothetical protein
MKKSDLIKKQEQERNDILKMYENLGRIAKDNEFLNKTYDFNNGDYSMMDGKS